MSFHAGRTMHEAVPACAACSCDRMSGTSFGECSVSSTSQAKPECETISVVTLLHRLHHRPICNLPAAMACLKWLRGMSMAGSLCFGLRRVDECCRLPPPLAGEGWGGG